MNTKTANNGTGSKADATQTKDTQRGVTAIAKIEPIKVDLPPNPIAEKLKKVNELNRLIEKRKNLMEASEELNEFEINLTGEGETISLYDKKNKEVEIKKPFAVKKIVEILKRDVEVSLIETEQLILQSAA